MSTVIIYGPQGSGKTRNAEALRKHFGCMRVVDDWVRGDAIRGGDLVLTNEAPANVRKGVKVVYIEAAKKMAGLS